IRPIIKHLVDFYQYQNAGFAVQSVSKLKLTKLVNTNFYNRLNNDIEFKKLFEIIFLDYERVLFEIQSKENEINIHDFDDL
ncbi:hypothetical protein OHW97_17495, partial [Acinetobacter baumannii]|nr:hypothetical protein [Acinetobacter baumannii]